MLLVIDNYDSFTYVITSYSIHYTKLYDIEISLGRIYDYNKPYSKFLVLRKEIKEQQLAAQKNQAKQIEQTEKLIEKFRAKASKASMAQSLIKKLDRIDRIEVDEDDNSVMSLNFPVSVTPGKVVRNNFV